MTSASFNILLALAQGERHGYAIMKEAEAQGLRLGPGTLYTALAKLLSLGLIVEGEERADENDQRRRYYRITPPGLSAVRAEAEQLMKLAQVARRRLKAPTPARVLP